MIPNAQAGFRKGYSTTDNIFCLHVLNVAPTLNVAPDVICRKVDAKCTGARCVRKKKIKKILYNTTRGRTHLLPFF